MEISLNPEQDKAKKAPLRPLLIVAGAGTGKTRVLMSRILHLIENGAKPASICAITFTNKAAREMEDRISSYGHLRSEKPSLGTFHSLGARILRANAKLAGRNSNFVIFDDSDSFSLIKKVIKENKFGQKLGPSFFRDKFSRIKDGTLKPNTKDSMEEEIISILFEEYEQRLKKNNAFDFDDLLYKVVFLFKNFPNVLNKYQKIFRHILVDEYQDVSNMQNEFINLLASEAESLSVVGDSDQTIYSWRGSDIKIFLDFEKNWPKSQVVFLEENYRSSGNIIQAASDLIHKNSERPRISKEKTLWTKNDPGARIKIFEALSPEGEADWIASQIESIDLTKEKTAILYRTNAQSRSLEQSLLEREIPYVIFGGIKFYERREIKDILAGLRFVLNPEDSVSEDRLQKFLGKRRFSGLKEEFLKLSVLPPIEIIKFFIKLTDYFSYVEKNLTDPKDRRENIAELMRFAGEFEKLPEFLEKAALLQSTDQTQKTNGEAVELMTIHLAKGLEFDRVFVAGVSEGIMPHVRALSSDSELEEERRLLYVAMTRAKKNLCLSFYDLPSRFLTELPGNCTSFESQVSDNQTFEDGDERYITLD